MKKLLFVAVLLFVFDGIQPANAQILKKLGKKIENSANARAERKMDRAVEKSLDKIEGGVDEAARGAVSSTGENGEGPSDADILQMISVSSDDGQDIQPLPSDYIIKQQGNGPDIHLEYQLTIQTPEQSQFQIGGIMKMYGSYETGRGRTEMVLKVPIIGQMKTVILSNIDDPEHATFIDEKKKTYSIMDLSSAGEDDDLNLKIEKIGEEKLRGINTTRTRVTTGEKGESFHIWTTRDIPGYEKLLDMYSKVENMGSYNLWKELKAAGAEGLMVKMEMEAEGGSSTFELLKIEKTSIPESLLTVPSDYKLTKKTKTSVFGR